MFSRKKKNESNRGHKLMKVKKKCDDVWQRKYISTITSRHKQNIHETSASQNMTQGADISNGYNVLREGLI
jgi:hypothetical protein